MSDLEFFNVNELIFGTDALLGDSRQFDGIQNNVRADDSFDLRVFLTLGCGRQLLGHRKLRFNVQTLHPVSKSFSWYAGRLFEFGLKKFQMEKDFFSAHL